MQDQHVDRPGVYVRQRTELTGPNRPIGLKKQLSVFSCQLSEDSWRVGLARPCMEIIFSRLGAQRVAPEPENWSLLSDH